MSLPSGPTGMDPSQTAFFQALNIGTQIVKGQIELVADFAILKVGEKVSPSAAVLLTKLAIKPFEYGMEVHQVFQDGSVFDAAVLDISPDVLMTKFMAGLPHMFGNGFRNVASLCADIDFSFKEIEPVKAFLADPSAYLAANATAAPAAGGGAAEVKKEEKKVVEEEEDEEDVDFDLFG